MKIKRKALLLGRGYWGQILARYVREQYDLLEILGSDVGEKKLARALESSQVAFIATPLHAHFDLAKLALEHGCHVFVEKPTTPTLPELTALQSLARAQNRVLFTNYIYTFSQSIAHALGLLRHARIHAVHAKIAQYGRFYEGESVLEVLGVHYLSVFAMMEAQGLLHDVRVVGCEFLDPNLHSARVVLESSECPISLECSLLAQEKSRILRIQAQGMQNLGGVDSGDSNMRDERHNEGRCHTLCVDMLAHTPIAIEPYLEPAANLAPAPAPKCGDSPALPVHTLPIYDESQNLALSLQHFAQTITETQAGHQTPCQTYLAHEQLCQRTLTLLEQALTQARLT